MFKQLIDNQNIILKDMYNNIDIKLTDNVSISAFLVPHRNELSETVGYKIKSNKKSLIYIPDIDSWDEWDTDLNDLMQNNDILILDGTFYSKDEIKNRNIEKIPHPSIIDSMIIMQHNRSKEKNKVYFTHLNHTNRALDENSEEYNNVITSGYNILDEKQIFNL